MRILLPSLSTSRLLRTRAGRASLPGCAAEACYAAKAASYARDYRPPHDDVQLLFFSVETSGFIHRMAKDFLKRILASSNTA